MTKKLKEQKGSMAVFTIVTVLSFIIILTCIFMGAAGVRKAQIKTMLKIKDVYGQSTINKETIYNNIIRLTLDKTNKNLLIGENFTLNAKLASEDISNDTIVWTSSNPDVASVNNGVVTAIKKGKAIIKATTKNKEASCEVISVPQTWNLSKVVPIESRDGEIVPVPVGFTASSVSITNEIVENRVDTGFVIYENTESGDQAVTNDNYTELQKTRNQFVWVPTIEDKPMFATAIDDNGNTITVGQLYRFEGTASSFMNPTTAGVYSTTNSHHEPNVASNDGLTLEGENGLRQEFLEMKESVEKYGGFYIGRYETGNINTNKPVIIKENADIRNKTWNHMYDISKNAVQNEIAKVESRIIWGCQWDATLNWFLSSSKNSVKNFVTNSTGGNYAGTQGSTNDIVPTGYYAINNIYDMGGNVFDWTLEALYLESLDTTYRVGRGGSYARSAIERPAFSRGYYPANSSSADIGLRLTLYI